MFDLDRFIVDLRQTLGERSRQGIKEVVARAVSDPVGLYRCIGEPGTAGAQVLHHAPDLTVINVAWAPQQITLPHNNLLPAIIGMYVGREDNLFWRRISVPETFHIEAAGGQALGPGDVAILGSDTIHSVVNPLAKISGAIHVYLGDFLAVERSMWDSETLVEAPYDMAAVIKGMAVTTN